MSYIEDHLRVANSFSAILIVSAMAAVCWLALLYAPISPEVGLGARFNYYIPLLVLSAFGFASPFFRPAFEFFAWWALVLCFFSLCLAGLWQSGISTGSIIGGILPFSDAAGYFLDAKHLLYGHNFSDFSSRRPLFTAELSFLLGLANNNFPLTLFLLSVVAGLCVLVLVMMTNRRFGTFMAVALFFLIFLYYRRYIGLALTEQLGLSFGALGLAALWRGVDKNRFLWFASGLFFLSYALAARAGALFVLPALALASLGLFSGTIASRITRCCISLAAIATPFLIGKLFTILAGSPDANFSNWSYVLYGLLAGGDWTLALEHYPSLKHIEPVARAQRIYEISLDLLKENPARLLHGCIRAYREAFFGLASSIGSMFLINPPSPQMLLFAETYRSHGAVRALMHIYQYGYSIIIHIGFAGLLIVLVNFLFLLYPVVVYFQRSRFNVFLLVVFIGIVSSIPFAPPWDANSMRVYAATVPATALICLMSLQNIISIFFKRFHFVNFTVNDLQNWRFNYIDCLAITVSFVVVIGSFFAVLSIQGHDSSISSDLHPGRSVLETIKNHGYCIHLQDAMETEKSRVFPQYLVVPHDRFVQNLKSLESSYPRIGENLRRITPPSALFLTSAPGHGAYRLVGLDGNPEPVKPSESDAGHEPFFRIIVPQGADHAQ